MIVDPVLFAFMAWVMFQALLSAFFYALHGDDLERELEATEQLVKMQRFRNKR